MHVRGLCGVAAAIAALADSAAAFSNTSPFVLLSESHSLRLGQDANLGPAVPSMSSALESIASDAALSCDYDAYIFVKQPHVSERDVNARTMPWLTHAAKKVRESILLGTVLDGASAEVDETAQKLEESIAKKCGAKPVAVDPETGAFDYYADTQARILSIDLAGASKSPADADTMMRDIIGHLPSANFLLTYRTTPLGLTADAQASASSGPQDGSQGGSQNEPGARPRQSGDTASDAASPVENIPYESVFRNYQFFSPGLFMGLIASALALAVMLIGLKAVNSLQISPAAFEPRRQVPRKSAQ